MERNRDDDTLPCTRTSPPIKEQGRPIVVAVDHSPNSRHAFDWALSHLCRAADTLHLVHVLPKSRTDSTFSPDALFESTSALMEMLAIEADEVGMVKTEVQITCGEEVGKAIVDVVKMINPIAVVLGRPAHNAMKSFLHGGVADYCSRYCPCPVILVPPES